MFFHNGWMKHPQLFWPPLFSPSLRSCPPSVTVTLSNVRCVFFLSCLGAESNPNIPNHLEPVDICLLIPFISFFYPKKCVISGVASPAQWLRTGLIETAEFVARGMVSVPGIVDVNISSRWLLVVISLSAGDVQVEHVITPWLPMK